MRLKERLSLSQTVWIDLNIPLQFLECCGKGFLSAARNELNQTLDFLERKQTRKRKTNYLFTHILPISYLGTDFIV